MCGGLFHGIYEELHGRANYTWWGKLQALIVTLALAGIAVLLITIVVILALS